MRKVKQGKLTKLNRHILIGLKDMSEYSDTPYWVGGSIICAALNKSFYRKIGDIDVLINNNDFIYLEKFLKNRGYIFAEKKPWTIVSLSGFNWTDATKGKICISIVKANFNSDGSCYIPLKFGFSGYLPAVALTQTVYHLDNITFTGLPPESLYYRIKIEYGDKVMKHRIKDLLILKQKINQEKFSKLIEEKPGLKFMGIYLPINRSIASFLRAFNLQRH